MSDIDHALYIEYAGREWCVWLSPMDELIAIPIDEENASDRELLSLSEYLCTEGFFSEHFKRTLADQEEI